MQSNYGRSGINQAAPAMLFICAAVPLKMGNIVRGRIVLKTGIIIPMSSKPVPLKILGERIRELRKVKNLTQEDLAYESDIDRSYIGGVERGERNLSFDKLCQIAQALGCDVASLTKNLPKELSR
jgi:DNA-binding XRE family transcriptional regulator